MTISDTAGMPAAARSAAAGTPPVRRISQSDLDWALAEGWRDFREMRGDILVVALLYPVLGFAAAAVTLDNRLLPLFFPLVAGVSLLGPAAASGFYELARRREEGLHANWVHFLDPFRGANRYSLEILSGCLVILFFLWLAAAATIAAITVGYGPAVGVVGAAAFIHKVLYSPEGWTMILLGNLVGFLFAVVTLVLGLVSFPMVVDGADPWTAVMTSIRAVRKNRLVTEYWGLRVAGLLALGCLPAFIGLAVVLPVLGYATWHLYTRLVDRSVRPPNPLIAATTDTGPVPHWRVRWSPRL
jgi:uncharacterized membrane protein